MLEATRDLMLAVGQLHREVAPHVPLDEDRAAMADMANRALRGAYHLMGTLLTHGAAAVVLIERGLWGEVKILGRAMLEVEQYLSIFCSRVIPGFYAAKQERQRANGVISRWERDGRNTSAELRTLVAIDDAFITEDEKQRYEKLCRYTHSTFESTRINMDSTSRVFHLDGTPGNDAFRSEAVQDLARVVGDATAMFLIALQVVDSHYHPRLGSEEPDGDDPADREHQTRGGTTDYTDDGHSGCSACASWCPAAPRTAARSRRTIPRGRVPLTFPFLPHRRPARRADAPAFFLEQPLAILESGVPRKGPEKNVSDT